MANAYCPSCDAVITQDSPRMGANISCRECGVALEVITVSPFEVDFPLDNEEDWGDDKESYRDY